MIIPATYRKVLQKFFVSSKHSMSERLIMFLLLISDDAEVSSADIAECLNLVPNSAILKSYLNNLELEQWVKQSKEGDVTYVLVNREKFNVNAKKLVIPEQSSRSASKSHDVARTEVLPSIRPYDLLKLFYELKSRFLSEETLVKNPNDLRVASSMLKVYGAKTMLRLVNSFFYKGHYRAFGPRVGLFHIQKLKQQGFLN